MPEGVLVVAFRPPNQDEFYFHGGSVYCCTSASLGAIASTLPSERSKHLIIKAATGYDFAVCSARRGLGCGLVVVKTLNPPMRVAVEFQFANSLDAEVLDGLKAIPGFVSLSVTA